MNSQVDHHHNHKFSFKGGLEVLPERVTTGRVVKGASSVVAVSLKSGPGCIIGSATVGRLGLGVADAKGKGVVGMSRWVRVVGGCVRLSVCGIQDLGTHVPGGGGAAGRIWTLFRLSSPVGVSTV